VQETSARTHLPPGRIAEGCEGLWCRPPKIVHLVLLNDASRDRLANLPLEAYI
jgi:hypothetical protein